MAEINIISLLNTFDEANNTFNPSNIGAEARLVGALPASNNNNIEEQYIMDVDKVTTYGYNIGEDENRGMIDGEYYSKDINFISLMDPSNKYYRMEIKRYVGGCLDDDVCYKSNGKIYFSNNIANAVSGTTLPIVEDTTKIDYDNQALIISTDMTLEKDNLKYYNTDVSEKIITQSFEGDALVIQEDITNKLR